MSKADNPRILLIEDDDSMCRSIEHYLKAAGFNVYATDMGEEGVDLAVTYDWDVIVTDLGLPDISGYEVITRVRAAGVTVPIMVECANPDVEAKIKVLGMGADVYVDTPFNMQFFVAQLRALCCRWNDLGGRPAPPALDPEAQALGRALRMGEWRPAGAR